MQRKAKSFDNTVINYEINNVSDSRLAFRITLVLLHGAGGDLSAWKKYIKFFSNMGISTIAVDLRGHGKSGRPDKISDYNLEGFAKDIKIVLEKEKIKRFALAGHCFGGMVAITFEGLYPNLAEALVLINTPDKSPKRLKHTIGQKHFGRLLGMIPIIQLRKKEFRHNDFEKYMGKGDWNVLRIYSDITHTSFKSWIYTFQNTAGFDGTSILKKIKRPVLVIHGEKDSIFSVSKAKEIHKLAKKSRLSIIPDANHVLVINKPEELKVEVCSFLLSLR